MIRWTLTFALVGVGPLAVLALFTDSVTTLCIVAAFTGLAAGFIANHDQGRRERTRQVAP